MVLFYRKRVFAAKAETTVGTAISLTGTDAKFNTYNLQIQPALDIERRNGQGNGFGKLPSVPGGKMAKCTFRTDMAYDGTNIPTWASVLLPACGFVNTAGVFSPVSEGPGSNTKTLTMAAYINGKVKKIYGAMGTAKFTLPAAKMAFVDWEFTGILADESDTSILAPDYPNDTALKFSNGASTWDSVSMCLQQAVIDLGNTVIMRPCSTTATGWEHALITDRTPKITGNPESVLVATQDRYLKFTAGTEAALSIAMAGPGTSSITFAAPKAQIVSIQEADRDGIACEQIDWECNKNVDAVDQEMTITFTATS